VAYVGDSLESAYLVAWNVRQFFRAPARLFEANVLYPHRHALAFTDHRLLPSLAVAPVLWATGNPVLASNVAIALAGLLAAFGAAAAVAALLFAPIAIPYARAAREQGYVRELPPGIDLQHYVSTAPFNLVYGAIGADVRLQQRGPHFVGFVALALAAFAIGAWLLRRGGEGEGALPASVWVPAAAALALLFVALSLGRDAFVFGHRVGP